MDARPHLSGTCAVDQVGDGLASLRAIRIQMLGPSAPSLDPGTSVVVRCGNCQRMGHPASQCPDLGASVCNQSGLAMCKSLGRATVCAEVGCGDATHEPPRHRFAREDDRVVRVLEGMIQQPQQQQQVQMHCQQQEQSSSEALRRAIAIKTIRGLLPLRLLGQGWFPHPHKMGAPNAPCK